METAAPTPRPDLTAYRQAVSASFPDVVRALVSIVGRKQTAYIASVKDARAIDRWMEQAIPQKDVEQRVRLAYQVATLLRSVDSDSVVQAWLIGLNPELNDAVPITLLREGHIENDGKRVLNAARAFVVGGLFPASLPNTGRHVVSNRPSARSMGATRLGIRSR
jgi:hypothetical protein